MIFKYFVSPHQNFKMTIHIKKCQPQSQHSSHKYYSLVLQKAANGSRTRDLRITNATLYHLSYSSLMHLYASQFEIISQQH